MQSEGTIPGGERRVTLQIHDPSAAAFTLEHELVDRADRGSRLFVGGQALADHGHDFLRGTHGAADVAGATEAVGRGFAAGRGAGRGRAGGVVGTAVATGGALAVAVTSGGLVAVAAGVADALATAGGALSAGFSVVM